MNRSQIQKLIIIYSSAAVFIGSCLYWHDPLLGMLSAGFMLGFLVNENLFNYKENNEN